MQQLKKNHAQSKRSKGVSLAGYKYVQNAIIRIDRGKLKSKGRNWVAEEKTLKISIILRFIWSEKINWLIKRIINKKRLNYWGG